MLSKMLKYTFLIINLIPAFIFGLGAYKAFTGEIDLGYWGGIAFLVTAMFFLFIAIKGLKSSHVERSEKEIETLKSTGEKRMTQFKALDRRWNMRINGQSPLVIYSQDSTGRVFENEDLWFDGGDSSKYNDARFQAWQQLQSADPSKQYRIPVYVDSFKPSHYHMDLADLQV